LRTQSSRLRGALGGAGAGWEKAARAKRRSARAAMDKDRISTSLIETPEPENNLKEERDAALSAGFQIGDP
jgi:hypothetical protein